MDLYEIMNSHTFYKKRRHRASNYIHRQDVRERILKRDNYTCQICGSQDNLTIDHIISVYRNGSNDDSNLQVLCRSCNSRKSP